MKSNKIAPIAPETKQIASSFKPLDDYSPSKRKNQNFQNQNDYYYTDAREMEPISESQGDYYQSTSSDDFFQPQENNVELGINEVTETSNHDQAYHDDYQESYYIYQNHDTHSNENDIEKICTIDEVD